MRNRSGNERFSKKQVLCCVGLFSGGLPALRSWPEGGCTFCVHHDDSLHALLALKSLQCLLHLCLPERIRPRLGGVRKAGSTPSQPWQMNHTFQQVTPRHMALPESSPGLFGMVSRPPPASKPSSSQYGVGLCSWPFAHQGPFAPQLLGSRIQIPFPGVQTQP